MDCLVLANGRMIPESEYLVQACPGPVNDRMIPESEYLEQEWSMLLTHLKSKLLENGGGAGLLQYREWPEFFQSQSTGGSGPRDTYEAKYKKARLNDKCDLSYLVLGKDLIFPESEYPGREWIRSLTMSKCPTE